jgi:hypothetical protein
MATNATSTELWVGEPVKIRGSNYTHKFAALADGGDIALLALNYSEGIALCDQHADCCGITFSGADLMPKDPVQMWVKRDCQGNGDPDWNSWLKEGWKPPSPAPTPAPGDGWIFEQATTTVHNKVNENGCNVSSLRNFSTSTRFPAQATVAA